MAPDPAGDAPDAAFDALFRQEYGRVAGIARRVLQDRDEAMDVAQEVFLAAYRLDVHRRPGAAGWLSTAAAHTALNHARSARRRDRRESRDAGAAAALRADADGGPQSALERAEDRFAVRRLLARLPRRQAALLVLRHSGLGYADIARALGLSPGSVGTLLRRAEATMRKEWERHASQ